MNFDYRSLSEIARDIDERRADRDNHFFPDFVETTEWFKTLDNSHMINASRGPTAVTIIFIIFTGILLIILILALLNVLKTKKSKVCLILGIICWFVYSFFFWAALTL